MAIVHVSTGTALSGNAGTTTVSIGYPASLAAPNMVLCGRTVKPSTATAADETGWTAVSNGTGGTAVAGLDVGTTRGKVDQRQVRTGDTGSITFDQASTPDSVSGCMIQYSKAANMEWEIVATTGDDTAHGTGRAATGSAISLQAGDVIVAFVHSDTDATTAWTAPAITATGMTFTTTERLAPSGASQGNDSGLSIIEGAITAGTLASVAPSISLSSGPSNCGLVTFVRLREVRPPTAPVMPTRIAP